MLYMKCYSCDTACRMTCYASHCSVFRCHHTKCWARPLRPRSGDQYRPDGSLVFRESRGDVVYYYLPRDEIPEGPGARTYVSIIGYLDNGNLELRIDTDQKLYTVLLPPLMFSGGNGGGSGPARTKSTKHASLEGLGRTSSKRGRGRGVYDAPHHRQQSYNVPRGTPPQGPRTQSAERAHTGGCDSRHQYSTQPDRRNGPQEPDSPTDPEKMTTHDLPNGDRWVIVEMESMPF